MATNYIHRTIESKIEEMYDNFPSILITGSRQSGKSTVLQYITTTKNIHPIDDKNYMIPIEYI